jgi:Cu2+-exporting ATPase
MSCCAPGIEGVADMGGGRDASDEIALASRALGERLRQTDLAVPGIHCGGCIQAIERALQALPGVEHARVNLSTRRVSVRWTAEAKPPPLIETLARIGYEAHLADIGAGKPDDGLAELIRALAVAGFAASNIMLLSVSVWAGAEGPTRDLFHWISAFIALPALIYSGRVFFGSAWRSLRSGRTNMDVPISVGVSLAFAMSLYETVTHGPHAYFDAAVSLLFFLLIGRTLDHMMRGRARIAVTNLARLATRGARVVRADGTRDYVPVGEIAPGMAILVAAGERIPVDARVEQGCSDLDCSLVTGESAPQPVAPGAQVEGGTLNLTGPLTVTAIAAAKDSFLAEVVRLMEAAEAGRSSYRRIADRAARLYAPAVHLTALVTFIGWMAAGGDWHRAMTVAIAVLIITCPCALGLAVPMVQMVAARRLFDRGIMVKDGAAMERLAEIDTVVFDKTGTLTLGTPRLVGDRECDPAALAVASAMAAHSRHPHARALAALTNRPAAAPSFDRIAETPGLGLEAVTGTTVFRLGRADWALPDGTAPGTLAPDIGTVLAANGTLRAAFRFDDMPRPGAREAIAALAKAGLAVEILSGDRPRPVAELATSLGITRRESGVRPGEKVSRLAALATAGHKTLMVGDGLNDAPALAAAHVSMAPATAADIGRNAADFVFLHRSLAAVPFALAVSRQARRLVRQNFALAIGYNVVALPVAILGHVTPLIAAIAMSLSSIMVVANALRLSGTRGSVGDDATAGLGRPRTLSVEPAE